MAEQQSGQKQWAQVVAKAWGDAAFKKRLLAEPRPVQDKEGLELLRWQALCPCVLPES